MNAQQIRNINKANRLAIIQRRQRAAAAAKPVVGH